MPKFTGDRKSDERENPALQHEFGLSKRRKRKRNQETARWATVRSGSTGLPEAFASF